MYLSCVSSDQNVTIRENVIFHRVNEIHISQGRWLITMIHDLKPFVAMVDSLYNDFELIKAFDKGVTGYYETKHQAFRYTIDSLFVEIEILNDTLNSIKLGLRNVQSIGQNKVTDNNGRVTRALIPIVGDALSFLFGTVSSTDLENIDKNIRTLASNQKKIVHDLQKSMSILNITMLGTYKNRRSIMEITRVLHDIGGQMAEIKNTFEKRIAQLEQFIHVFLQLQMVIDEFKMSAQNAIIYLENLKSELNMLALNHLSTDIIQPEEFQSVLLEIREKLPVNFNLPVDPKSNIWHYYEIVTCSTYIENDQIRIIMEVPLIHTVDEFDVYQVYNLPLPLPHGENKNLASYSAKYDVSDDYFIVSKSRSMYSILDHETFDECSVHMRPYCKPRSPLYQLSESTSCIMALFLGQANSKVFCNNVVVRQRLPNAFYLTDGIWIVSTSFPLTFTITCRREHSTQTVIVKFPFGIIQLNKTCKAYNSYLNLPEYFEQGTSVIITDPLSPLLTLHNLSNFQNWESFRIEFPKLREIVIPPELDNLKEIPMKSFISQIKEYEQIQSSSHFSYTQLIIGIILGAIIVLIIVYCIKTKCKHCMRLINCILMRHTRSSSTMRVSYRPALINEDDGESTENVATGAMATCARGTAVPSSGQTAGGEVVRPAASPAVGRGQRRDSGSSVDSLAEADRRGWPYCARGRAVQRMLTLARQHAAGQQPIRLPRVALEQRAATGQQFDDA